MIEVDTLLKALPRRIKVGAYDWRVILNEEEADIEKCGEADFEHHVVNLWPSHLNSPDHAVGIVIHELLHVIFDNADLEGNHTSPDPEEEIVIGFEQGLVALYRDNPRLLTWIKKGLK
ncbi:hypothetical protein [Bradyrhizobium erythrophlei]|uniref:Uncharacterized protein n=1 Tax=Bradyrhizobium erythrophlei TaxID=1437360 RepID=A0A1M5TBA3_9BRAD|nr:hypothetical protein [Bradyrhizobium erythrophlei]SHH47999.1 hypothetical protein SAMN05444169_7659 [Bradyrhizobium erythrophlei]